MITYFKSKNLKMESHIKVCVRKREYVCVREGGKEGGGGGGSSFK